MTSKCPQLKAFKVEYNHDTISYWEATLYLTGKQHYDLTGKQHYDLTGKQHYILLGSNTISYWEATL
jgi:hypothetical protein